MDLQSHILLVLFDFVVFVFVYQRNGQMATKYAMKTLTVCTAASVLAREELLKSDKSEKWLTC